MLLKEWSQQPKCCWKNVKKMVQIHILLYRNTGTLSSVQILDLQHRGLISVIPRAEKLLKREIQVKVSRKLENQQFETRSRYNRNKEESNKIKKR